MSDLREGWNFHNDIAIPLERTARRIFNLSVESCYQLGFSAGLIESSEFAKVMICLVREAPKRDCDKLIDNFVIKCSEHVGKSGNEIDRNISNELFEEFVNLIEY